MNLISLNDLDRNKIHPSIAGDRLAHLPLSAHRSLRIGRESLQIRPQDDRPHGRTAEIDRQSIQGTVFCALTIIDFHCGMFCDIIL